jgi:bacillithiol system protein YtxJ
MAPEQIREKSALEEALASDLYLLFKHSPACPVSGRAFAAYGEFNEEYPEVPTGWIDVIAQRPWSQWVASETGITHESPQALVIRGGNVAWHESHLAITADALADASGM